LTAKLSVLRASRRILRPGGRTAFYTIAVSEDLSKRDHRRAVRLGPRAVASTRGQAELVAAAGFVDIDEVDVTAEFLDTARAWLRFSLELEPTLRIALGDELFDQRMVDRTDLVRATEEGLLRRLLLVGTAPP
jgi:hypothetical protein